MSKKRYIVTGSVAVALIVIAISFRVLHPSIEVHGSLSTADLDKIQRLVSNYQRAAVPWSMSAVRQRFFQPIQCIYVTRGDCVWVVCALRKHAYDGYSHDYEFERDSREPSGWRLCGESSGNRGYGFL
jgi:hypothetical protein